MSRDVKKAMILAAGLGTRLRPLTLEVPKVLVPVGGVPLLERTLAWLRRYGIEEVAINLHHLGEKVVDYLGDGSRFGMTVMYSWEDELLGTAGGVKKVEYFFDDTFVVVYGDVLTNLDLGAMVRLHTLRNAVATLALTPLRDGERAGVVWVNEDGRATKFVEKPGARVVADPDAKAFANGGVYVLKKQVLEKVPPCFFGDFGYDVFPKIISNGFAVYGYVLGPSEYLVDIGTPEGYREANKTTEMGGR